MEIALSLKGEQQQQFLAYLNSALRERMQMYRGTAQQGGDGNFLVSTSGSFKIAEKEVLLVWTLYHQQDGALAKLVVEREGGGADQANWERAVHEIVTSASLAALSQKKGKYFQRTVFQYVGPQLSGEYWLPGFRFAPVLPNDPEPTLYNAERVIAIDQNVEAVDERHAGVLASFAAKRHAARLSLILNIGIYTGETTLRWVLPIVENVPARESVRYHLGFHHPLRIQSKMPKKGQLCGAGKSPGSIFDEHPRIHLTCLPKETRTILRGLDAAAPTIRQAFDNAARLYQVGLVSSRAYPSVGLAYHVAAVEALSAYDEEVAGFSKFMRKFVRSKPLSEDTLNYLHGDVRSAHFHSGKFPWGEFSESRTYSGPFMDAEWVQRDSLHRASYRLMRDAIANWIKEVIISLDSTVPKRTRDGEKGRTPSRNK